MDSGNSDVVTPVRCQPVGLIETAGSSETVHRCVPYIPDENAPGGETVIPQLAACLVDKDGVSYNVSARWEEVVTPSGSALGDQQCGRTY